LPPVIDAPNSCTEGHCGACHGAAAPRAISKWLRLRPAVQAQSGPRATCWPASAVPHQRYRSGSISTSDQDRTRQAGAPREGPPTTRNPPNDSGAQCCKHKAIFRRHVQGISAKARICRTFACKARRVRCVPATAKGCVMRIGMQKADSACRARMEEQLDGPNSTSSSVVDLRQSANLACWPAQRAMEGKLTEVFAAMGHELRRAQSR
jgi:hypothetical protein